MGEALFELEQVLKSKQGKLTPQEASILESCKSKAVREFTSSAVAAGTVLWTATWKLNKLFRINLAAGAAAFFGLSRFSRSLDSCADYILELEGSRMQMELANILVTKFHNDHFKMQLISKHFYTEKIYDDSTSDHPKLRWRYRNSFGDNVGYGQSTHNYDTSDISLGDSPDDSNNVAQGNPNPKVASDSTRTNLDTKPIFIKPDLHNQMEEADPLDYLFGYSAPVEEIHPSSTSNKAPGISNRGHKRSHRRRRMRHQEDLLDYEV